MSNFDDTSFAYQMAGFIRSKQEFPTDLIIIIPDENSIKTDKLIWNGYILTRFEEKRKFSFAIDVITAERSLNFKTPKQFLWFIANKISLILENNDETTIELVRYYSDILKTIPHRKPGT
jgi:hypothetical protein